MKIPKLPTLTSLFGVLLVSAMSAFAVPVILDDVPQTASVRDGLSITLVVNAESAPPVKVLAYQWFKRPSPGADGVQVANANGISGANTAKLKFTGAKAVHQGLYYVRVFEPGAPPVLEEFSEDYTLQVNVRPVIAASGQPVSAVVSQGALVTFSVALTPDSTTAGLTYQWQKNNVDIPAATNATANSASFVIPAAAPGSETTAGAQVQDIGSYRVKIVSSLTGTTPLTNTTIFSKVATLKVNSQPVILKQPAADTGATLYVANKASGKLTVVAGGNPKLEYQWEKKNGTLETTDDDISGAKAAALTITGATASEGEYRVRVKNLLTPSGVLGTWSNYATVVVLNKPLEVGPIVVTSNKTANAKGEYLVETSPDTEVTLTVNPNDEPADDTGVLEFQWQKDGKNILDELVSGEPNPGGVKGVSGAQTAAIKLAPLSWLHRGVYRCVIKNKVGTVTSKTYTLKVNSKPIIITQPVDLVGIKDKAVTFTVVAGGNAPLNYQWFKENGETDNEVSKKTASPKLTLSKLGDTHEGDYYCVVSNAFGSTTTELASLRVDSAVKIGVQPASVGVTTGGDLTLSFTISQGDGPVSVQWQRNNVNLANSATVTGAVNTVAVPNSAEPVKLIITGITMADAGNYRALVSNVNGAVKVTSATAKVTVLTPPSLTQQPADLDAFEDSNVTFTVKAVGSPALKYKWEVAYGNTVPTADGDYTALVNGPTVAGATTATLTVKAIQFAAQGYYRCVVSNPTGIDAKSDPAFLIVNAIPAPTITSFTPKKARTGDKIRVTGTNMQFVKDAWFGAVGGTTKSTVVKESDTTVLISVVGGVSTTVPVEIMLTSKNTPDGVASTDQFVRSTAQVNDRNFPTIVVGSTFPPASGATTASLTNFYELPATGLGEAVYTWVFPKAGTYGVVINSNFQVWLGYEYANKSAIKNSNSLNPVFRGELVVDDDNTPVKFSVFGVDGWSSFLPNFGKYVLQVNYLGPVLGPSPVAGAAAPASTDAAVSSAAWNVEGNSGTLKVTQSTDGEEASSFTGSSAKGAKPTVLWSDASDVEAQADSVIRTEWTMAIDKAGAGVEGHFGWQVAGSNGAPLGQLQFSVADGAIYLVQPDGTRTALEPQLVPGSSHRFEITTDLGNATWQARMDGVALAEPLPLPAGAGFGDVSVIWYPANAGQANPTMTFDDVSITVD